MTKNAKRREAFRAIGAEISARADRDYHTGDTTGGEWKARGSQEPRRERVPFGPQLRVMQLDRGTVKP